MSFSSWLRNWKRPAPTSRRATPRQRIAPRLEVLEARVVPSGYQQTNLVSYQAGLAHFTDSNLNGWGMTSMPDGSFAVANAFTTGLVTFYDRSGHVLPQSIIVPSSSVPTLFGNPGSAGHPTGVVYNATSDFKISEDGRCAPALLIFDTLDGTISGWNPAVDPTRAIVIRDTWAEGDPAVYTGLEIGHDSAGDNVLYATDFLGSNGTPTAPNAGSVEMIGKGVNGDFTTLHAFTDASVPSFSDGSYGAWSVQAVGDKLYVTYASLLDLGGGVVDVFDSDGGNMVRFAANFAGSGPNHGPLQNPWGITQAPANFGAYSGDILIGNVAGAGNIDAFDPATGAYLGQLDQPNGAPIAIRGLWDLEFGDGTPKGGKTDQLFFDAGPNHPGDATGGTFGVIHAAGQQAGALASPATSGRPLAILRDYSGTLTGSPAFAVLRMTGTAEALGNFSAYGELTFTAGDVAGTLIGQGLVAFTAANGDKLVGVIAANIGANGADGAVSFVVHWRDAVTFKDGTTIASSGPFVEHRPAGLTNVTKKMSDTAEPIFQNFK